MPKIENSTSLNNAETKKTTSHQNAENVVLRLKLNF
jgi:hypothetical protein